MCRKALNNLNTQPRVSWHYIDVIKEYLKATVLNGLKYLTFEDLKLWEKLLFLCCFIAAAYNSVDFGLNAVGKWKMSPVITVMSHQTSSIKREPFPAVTICNMNQARDSKVKDFDTKSLDYAMLQKLCFQEINFTSFSYNQPKSRNYNFSKFIIENTQPCAHMVTSCAYGYSKIACSDLFREVLLDEGLCCTFNAVHPYLLYKGDYLLARDYTAINGPAIPLNWNPDEGYTEELPASFYPRLPLGAGPALGLSLVLNGDYDNYYCSSANGPGFKVSIHNPIEIANIKDTGLIVALGMQTSFPIVPERQETSPTLRVSTTSKERQCYFGDEYTLRYFRFYTQHNCEMECDAEFMLQRCNCISYHLPLLSNNATPCHVRHFDCLVEAEKVFSDPTLKTCYNKCLPNCNDLTYTTNSFVSVLDNEGFRVKNFYLRNMSKDDLKKHAVLNIYFSENYYRSTFKNAYMSTTSFLSHVGGIMSLLTGFSVIALVELVYFFLIKPLMYGWRKMFPKNTVQHQPDEIVRS